MHDLMRGPYEVACYAAELAADFRVAVNEYLESGSFEQVEYKDLVTGEQVIALRRVKAMPVNFSNKAADVINNLRSALDQAAYAVSVAAGGRGKKTYFPVAKTLKDAEDLLRGNSSEIPEAIFKYMLSWKPYEDGDYELWAIVQIGNAYKHREILRSCAVARQSVKLSIYIGESGADDTIKFPIPLWDECLGELVVCRYRGVVPNFKADLLGMVSFSFGWLEHKPADGVLLSLSRKVKLIIEGVEKEALKNGILN